MQLQLNNNQRRSRTRLISGVLSLVAWSFVFKGTFLSLYSLATSDEGHSHLLALPFLAGFFIFSDRNKIFNSKKANPALQKILSIFLLATGMILFMADMSLSSTMSDHDSLSLATAAALIILIGIFMSTVPKVHLSEAVFPAVLLLLMIPIPTGAREALVTFLVKGSSDVTEILLRITGSSFFRDGDVFMLPGLSVEIARECSGIRSSIGLLITVLLASHMFLKKYWSKGALLAAVIPLALIKNAMRITALTLLSIHVDRSFLDNSLHHTYGGMVFFGLTMVIFLFPILLLLQKLEEKEPKPVNLNGTGI